MNILLQDGISGAYSARSRGELDMASRQPYVQTLLTMGRQNVLEDRIRLAFDLKVKVVPAQLMPPIIPQERLREMYQQLPELVTQQQSPEFQLLQNLMYGFMFCIHIVVQYFF